MTNPFKNIRRRAQPVPRTEMIPVNKGELVKGNDTNNELIKEIQENVDLTPAQAQRLNQWIARQELGMAVSTSPLICREGCPHRELCPLYAENIHPLNKPCPIEAGLVLMWKKQWAKSLEMDLGGEIDAFDLKILDDLATISVLKRRAMAEMSIESPLTVERSISSYYEDLPIEKVELNPRVHLIERLGKLEIKLYNELLATRKAKFNAMGKLNDLSRRQAELKERMRKIQEEERKKAEIIDAEYKVDD